ncbi:MAG TPA: hypothetical protein VKT78_08645 [Fimbriimonadaceae bacterium]|nr:hypothetical protein [Fimbriimonadaceae bacterium]
MSSRPDPFTQFMNSGRAATYTLIALLGGCYILAWITRSPLFFDGLAFNGDWSRPWTVVTYPFAGFGFGGGLLGEVFLLLWLYWIGTDLERGVGTGRVFGLFVGASLIGAGSLYAAWQIFSHGAGLGHPTLAGSLIPIGALTVTWGVRNPHARILIWFVLPITGTWIAILDALLVFLVVGGGNPLVGAFALVPLAAAWALAANRLPGPTSGPRGRRRSGAAKATERMDQTYYDDVRRREKDREERERLRKLFESSVDDDKK